MSKPTAKACRIHVGLLIIPLQKASMRGTTTTTVANPTPKSTHNKTKPNQTDFCHTKTMKKRFDSINLTPNQSSPSFDHALHLLSSSSWMSSTTTTTSYHHHHHYILLYLVTTTKLEKEESKAKRKKKSHDPAIIIIIIILSRWLIAPQEMWNANYINIAKIFTTPNRILSSLCW